MINIAIFGDSHSNVFNKFNVDGVNIFCNSISGGTISGLPKRISTLNIKNIIIDYLKNNSPDYIIFKFGQVDIELGYYYKNIIKNENINKEDYIKYLLDSYISFINEIEKYIDINKIIICGINPPCLISKSDCFEYTKRIIFENVNNNLDIYIDKLNNLIENINNRTKFSTNFNYELRNLCKNKNIKYIEVFNELLTNEGILNDIFVDNNKLEHHIKGISINSQTFEPINKYFKNLIFKLIKTQDDLIDTIGYTDIYERYINCHYEYNGILKPYYINKGEFHQNIINYDNIYNLEIASEEKKLLLFHFSFKQDDIVLELGAYKGLGSMKLSNYVGSNGKVISVEGLIDNYNKLCQNININKKTNILPINAFISNENRIETLYSNEEQINTINPLLKRNWNNKYEINVYKMDYLLKQNKIDKITYILLEINLGEYNALLGLKETLINNNYIRIVCAAWYDIDIRDKIISYLESLNFKVYIGIFNRLYALKY